MTELNRAQTNCLRAAQGKAGFAYFLDMGLGKTLAALVEFTGLVATGQAQRLLVICPNSFKGGWEAEVSKHRLKLAVHIYSAEKHKAAEGFIRGPFSMPPMLIVNYESMRLKKVQELIFDYTTNRKVMLVCDESIAIKNPTAKRTRAILNLRSIFPIRRILSGKPTTQGSHDLWAQLTLIGATDQNFYAFRNLFCQMGGYEGKEVIGVKNEALLRRLMEPYVFRGTKAEYLPDLPDKTYTIRAYALTGDLARHYAEMENLFLTWLKDQQQVMVEIALTKYGKLSQIHAGFIHDEGGVPQWLVEDKENPRLQTLFDILDETSSKVCIVFRHRFVGEQLKRVMSERGLVPALIEGSMKPAQIEEEKHFFNTSPRCRAILLQVDASKYGHTLVGTPEDPCYTMVFYESTYSLDTRSQIEDRIHRIGQKNACLYVDLCGTEMDVRVTQALQRKEEVYRKLFPSESVPVAGVRRFTSLRRTPRNVSGGHRPGRPGPPPAE